MNANAERAPGGKTEGLPELLRRWARDAPDGRLMLCVGAGAAGAAASVYWRTWGWPATFSAALCALAFGAWGIADRELSERAGAFGTVSRMLRFGRNTAEAIGWLSMSAFVFSLLSFGLGLWKS